MYLIFLKLILSVVVTLLLLSCQSRENIVQGEHYQLVIGTYTQVYGDSIAPLPFESEGLYRVSFNGKSFESLQLFASLQNPSFLTLSEGSDYLYVVEEVNDGNIVAYDLNAFEKTLRADVISKVSSNGSYPCYISLSPDNAMLAVTNYGSGNLSVYTIDSLDGQLLDTVAVSQHTGSGPNEQRQQSSHLHWVNWAEGGRRMYVIDLGADNIALYEQYSNWIEQQNAVSMKAGAGPRHMVFHPKQDNAYVLNELSNTLVSFNVRPNGTLEKIQQLSTLPVGYEGDSQAGHIAITKDGKYLYVSNRGHNSLVMFKVSQEGLLTKQQTISSAGRWPRHFLISDDQRLLFVANQYSHSIVPFQIGADGILQKLGSKIDVPQPAIISEIAN